MPTEATDATLRYDTVIVGAGIAGVAAAHTLLCGSRSSVHPRRSGEHRVLLVERNDRVGGRMHTEHVVVDGHTYALELGANWLQGADPSVNMPAAWVARLGVACIPSDGDGGPGTRPGLYLDAGGTPLSQAAVDAAWDAAVNVLHRCEVDAAAARKAAMAREATVDDCCADDADNSCSSSDDDAIPGAAAVSAAQRAALAAADGPLWDQIERVLAAAKASTDLDDRLRQYLLADPSHEVYLRHAVHSTTAVEYGADPTKLSRLFWDADPYAPGPELLVTGGYAAVPEAMLRECCETGRLDVRLGTACTGVEIPSSDSSRGCVVQLDSGEAVACGAVIVAVSLGVLQAGRVAFSPPLPPSHQEPLDRLRLGCFCKVLLVFPAVFWPRDAPFIVWNRQEIDAGWTEWVNLAHAYAPRSDCDSDDDQQHRRPLLCGLMATMAEIPGRRIEGLPDDAVVAEALAALVCMFPAAVPLPRPTLVRVTRWSAVDGGSYSSLPPGAMPADRAALAAPLCGGRVHIVGEHVDVVHPSTVNGAYDTGVAAARALLAQDV